MFGDALVKEQLCQPKWDQYFFFRGWNFGEKKNNRPVEIRS